MDELRDRLLAELEAKEELARVRAVGRRCFGQQAPHPLISLVGLFCFATTAVYGRDFVGPLLPVSSVFHGEDT